MKKATAVLSVKFMSSHNPEKLMESCTNGLDSFWEVPGLLEKYYLIEESTGAISGFYLFGTKSARSEFRTSELASKIPEKYGVIPETLRAEECEMAIVLNEPVVS